MKFSINQGFSIIEMIIAIAIITIFIAIFVQIGMPISQKIQANANELQNYEHLLFLTSFLDDLAQTKDFSISPSSSSTTTSTLTGMKTLINSALAKCGLSGPENQYFSCTFNHRNTETFDLINILDFGTTTIQITKKDNSYQMTIGKYILQFGKFPHIFILKD